MNLETYQQSTIRTCATLPSLMADTAHMLYGMCSELDELFGATDRVNAGEELTDILWYLANYANFYGFNLAEHYDLSQTPVVESWAHNQDIKVMRAISRLQDWEKKSLAYKKPYPDEKRLELTLNVLKELHGSFAVRALDVYRCMQNNIDKLRARYPEKFSEENALNRDILAERKILER